MTTVTISSKYQIVIPKKMRESMNLVSGVRLEMIPYNNRIELIPVQPMKSMRGVLKGMDTSMQREKDRVL